MATKSFLYGGGDAWAPNGVIPWGYNRETSLVWYENAGVLLTGMYAYEFSDSLGILGAAVKAGIDPNFSDTNTVIGALQFAQLVSTVIYTTYEMQAETYGFSGAFQSAQLTTVVQYSTYSMQDEFMQNSGQFLSATLATVVVTYSDYEPETYQLTGQFLGATLS